MNMFCLDNECWCMIVTKSGVDKYLEVWQEYKLWSCDVLCSFSYNTYFNTRLLCKVMMTKNMQYEEITLNKNVSVILVFVLYSELSNPHIMVYII